MPFSGASIWMRTKFLVFFPVLLWATAGNGQAPPLAGIAHVAFRVSDLNKSRDFYRKLGFEQAFEFADGRISTVAFMKVNDRQFIELYPRHDSSQVLGLMHVCYESTDISAVHDAYGTRGLDPSEVKKARAGNLLFVLHDPEGQLVEYTQYEPGSLHSMDRGQHLGAARVSDSLTGASFPVRDVSAEQAFYTEKLGFANALPTGPTLQLPGNSGDSIELESAPAVPGIAFLVENAKHTAKDLRHRGFRVQTSHHAVSVTDPDGFLIVCEQRGTTKQ